MPASKKNTDHEREPGKNERRCRIEGCIRIHRRNLFCCPVHWWKIPKPMRDEIWRTYRNGDGIFESDYLQACENAEAYLEDRDPKIYDGNVMDDQ